MNDQAVAKEEPWQLRMFQKTLKKKLRLKHLKMHIGPVAQTDKCLLITCGDNNGAMNYHLRALGGKWIWADLEDKSIKEMEEMLGDKVHKVTDDSLPFNDEELDRVVVIDVHEHLENTDLFTKEVWRVTKKEGLVVVTVPNGDETKIVTRLKNAVGMTKEKYGHVVEGYDVPDLQEILRKNGIQPFRESSFSKFFTEMLELSINFLYVIVLSKKSKAKVEQGTIAPSTKDQLKSVEKTYRLYSLVYPIFLAISQLDRLFFFTSGYAVMVSGKKTS